MSVNEVARPTKQQLRVQLLARRAQRSSTDRAEASDALCARVLALQEMVAATRVACYMSMPEEPGTRPLLSALSARGCAVLLPLLQTDYDMDWAAYTEGELRATHFGISEPTGEPLGADAVHDASVMICPGLAADLEGNRLGRGRGCYDRVLSRLPGGVLRVALLYDDEVLDVVPTDQNDERVHLIVTPLRTLPTLVPREP